MNKVTVPEFEKLSHDSHRELIRGTVIENSYLGAEAGIILGNVGGVVHVWAKQQAKSYCGFRVGHVLARNPDTVRTADVSYIRAEHFSEKNIPEGFWDLAPDLAVKVISPWETAQGIRDKVTDFLTASTRLVWVVYPRTQEVTVHTPDALARTYGVNDILEFDVLPGFTCSVKDLFEL